MTDRPAPPTGGAGDVAPQPAGEAGGTSTIGAGASNVSVIGHRRGARFSLDDWVADEVPVALEYNGIAHAVMLATPLDLDDFALGFSLNEGILDTPAQLYDVGARYHRDVSGRGGSDPGVTLSLHIAAAAFARLKEHRRTLAGRTGCGLCGTENLAEVYRPLAPLALPSLRDSADPRSASTGRIGRLAIARGLRAAAERQTLQRLTGAVHAATWISTASDDLLLREDVGRHNALDKLTGALAARSRRPGSAPDADAASGFIVVTSRASFEMVQKAVMARVPLLAAVSAPTALAVRVAQAAGLTLVGFARGDDLVAYTHPERIDWNDASVEDQVQHHQHDRRDAE